MCLDDYRRLARKLGTPPMFGEVLPLIVKHDEIELLVRVSERELSVIELSRMLDLPPAAVQSRIDGLYRRGFLLKKRNGEHRYSARPFEHIVSRHLGEGRTDALGKYMIPLAGYRMDEHVKRARSDPYPEGKVLPTFEVVVEPVSVVLPHETAMNILSKAKSVSLRDCECRVTFGNCAKPLRTCLAIDEFSDGLVERGAAVEISLNEAKAVLRTANEHGLVNQALYTDWIKGEVFDICSCCPCCCTYLRTLMKYGVRHHIARSGFLAEVRQEECNGCGVCVDRCIFGARKLENGKSVVTKEKCYGCGLCTTTCVSGASRLVP